MCSRLTLVARVAGGLVALAGALVLAGWSSDGRLMIPTRSGLPAMQAMTALLAVLTGGALVLLAAPLAPLAWRLTAGLCAAVTAAASALILIERATGASLGVAEIAQPFMRTEGHLGAALGGHAASMTAVAFLLASAALLALTNRGRRRVVAAQVLAAGVGSIALFVLLGYVFAMLGFDRKFPPASSAGMALHAAIVLVVLSAGILAARPDEGLVAIVTSARTGGVMARRLLLGMLAFIPLVAVVLLGQRRGWYDGPVVLAVLACLALIETTTFALLTGHRMNRDDVARAAVERRRLEGERRYRELFEHASDGVFLADLRGRYTEINGAGCRMLGYRREELIGKRIADFVLPGDLPRLGQEKARLLAGEVVVSEWSLRRADGVYVPVEASASILADGRWQAFVRDISDRKRAEAELERLREEWTSVVAHDLRQPVGTIALTAQALVRMHGGELSDKERRGLERIQSTSERLNRMIDDLLDLSLIEANRVTLDRRPLDLVSLVDSVVDDLHDTLTGHQLGVVAAQGLVAFADPDRIRQVLANLLSNAAKYGQPGTSIGVQLGGDDQFVEVTVTNRGAGIPPDELPGIFDRFRRSKEARAGRVPGLGLGLYIAKGLVVAHGGRIWAESEPGEATSFHFTVPRTPPAEEREHTVLAPSPADGPAG